MAVILKDPRAEAWGEIAQFLGKIGAQYYMNKDILDKINENIVGEDVAKVLEDTLGEGVASTVLDKTDKGYKLDLDELKRILSTENYKDNPILNELFQLGQARKSLTEKNFFAELKAISNPTVASAVAITGSKLTKAREKQDKKSKLEQFIKDVLGVDENYSPILDMVLNDTKYMPLLFMLLNKEAK